jgi:hypothetical protein
VPYDFDVTGMVNPDYGSPPAKLGIRRLTERLYRGACPAPDLLKQAVDLFVAKREAIRALYELQPGLGEVVRKRSLAYVDSFFAEITSNEQVENKILQACRTYHE